MAHKNTKNNGYSVESLRKVVSLMKETENVYMGYDYLDIKLCISSGNRKIGRVMNVSLPPILSCGNCKECMHFCYDIKACLQYPNTVIDARIRNYVILKKSRNEYFSRIEKAISRRRTNKYFRWHVSGEIIDIDYFARMVQIAKNHPDFIFWTYTKMYSIVNQYVAENGNSKSAAIPENLHIMFSEWDGTEMVNPFGFPEFTCKFPQGNKNHPDPTYFDNLYKCPGNCDICKALNRGCLNGETTYADLH